MSEMKTCKCGAPPVFIKVRTPSGSDNMWRCFCLACHNQTMAKFTKASAAKEWNRKQESAD